jgi:hypothetical protein
MVTITSIEGILDGFLVKTKRQHTFTIKGIDIIAKDDNSGANLVVKSKCDNEKEIILEHADARCFTENNYYFEAKDALEVDSICKEIENISYSTLSWLEDEYEVWDNKKIKEDEKKYRIINLNRESAKILADKYVKKE